MAVPMPAGTPGNNPPLAAGAPGGQPPASPPPPTGTPSTPPTSAAGPAQDPTLGSGSLPWLQRWQGGFQAPTSPWQNQALGSVQNLANGNFGLQGSQDYLNNLQSGQWLNPNNQYFDQIQQAGGQLKNTQDQRALQQLQSSAAAGGNALSGGLLQNEGDYMRNSNASFDQMMAQLRANQYSQERGYMNQAPGMQNALTNTALGGVNQEMNMGGVAQQTQTNEMQGAYQYPDQAAMAMLTGGGYRNTYNPSTGPSGAAGIAQLLAALGNGTGGIDLNSIMGLLGGGGSGGGSNTGTTGAGTDPFGGSATTATDAHPVHFNAATNPMTGPSNPFSYQDSNYYNNALTQQQGQAAQAQTPPNQGLNTGLGMSTLLLQLLSLLGGGSSNKQKNAGGLNAASMSNGQPATGGKGLIGTIGDLFSSPNNPNTGSNNPFESPQSQANNPDTIPLGSIDNPNGPYGQGDQPDFGNYNPLIDPNNFAGAGDGGGDTGGGGDQGVQF